MIDAKLENVMSDHGYDDGMLDAAPKVSRREMFAPNIRNHRKPRRKTVAGNGGTIAAGS